MLFGQQQDDVTKIQHINISGTQIQMDMPDVFIYDYAQSAYIYSGAAASVVVKEMNGTSFKSLQASVTSASLEKQQMKITSASVLTTKAGNEAKLFTASLNINSKDGSQVEFERMIFICGNDGKSVWITVQYPVVTKKLLAEVLRSCLISIEL
jgi:hypothetical protein